MPIESQLPAGGTKVGWRRPVGIILSLLPALLFLVLYYTRAEQVSWRTWTIRAPHVPLSLVRFAADGRSLEMTSAQPGQDNPGAMGASPSPQLEYHCDTTTHALIASRPIDAYQLVRAYASDENTLATGGPDGTLRLWRAQPRKLLHTLKGRSAATSLAFAPGGQVLASGNDGTVQIWDVKSGELQCTLRTNSAVLSVAFSPDGQLVAGATPGSILLWDARSGRRQRTLNLSDGPTGALLFSPDGQTLFSTMGYDGTILRWDTRTWKALPDMTGYTITPGALAISPDGKVLASASDDGTVRLRDAKSGALLRTIVSVTRSSGPVSGSITYDSVAFSPDGRFVGVTCSDGSVKVWRVR